MSETFTIVSTGAPLVEVDGEGPAANLQGGLVVPDGASTTAPVDLLNGFERYFRVDAAPSVTAKVNVTDSPLGALLTVRRCDNSPHPRNGAVLADPSAAMALVPVAVRGIAQQLWNMPVRDVARFVAHASPILLHLLEMLLDGWPILAPSCSWIDVIDKSTTAVDVHGGDIVVVSFVVP